MLKLDVDYSYDFEIFGIVSSQKEYKFAYYLNKIFAWNLFKARDITFSTTKGKLQFSNFEFEFDYNKINLIKNKSHILETKGAKPYLLPELKDYDYILKLESEGNVFKSKFIFDKIKEIPNIVLARRIDLENLKYKENLIF